MVPPKAGCPSSLCCPVAIVRHYSSSGIQREVTHRRDHQRLLPDLLEARRDLLPILLDHPKPWSGSRAGQRLRSMSEEQSGSMSFGNEQAYLHQMRDTQHVLIQASNLAWAAHVPSIRQSSIIQNVERYEHKLPGPHF